AITLLLQPVGFSGEDEVAFGQAIDFVRPDRELHFAPGQINIRMMALSFGQFTDLVCELESLAKVFEFIFLFEMMVLHYTPALSELVGKILQFITFERRRSAFTRYAFLFSKSCCHSPFSFPNTIAQTSPAWL